MSSLLTACEAAEWKSQALDVYVAQIWHNFNFSVHLQLLIYSYIHLSERETKTVSDYDIVSYFLSKLKQTVCLPKSCGAA